MVVDIFVHVLEQYFTPEQGTYVQDRLAESLMKTCIHYGHIALEEPTHYEARANLMWASSLALNGLLSYGKTGDWATHYIEHSVSAIYDITHGTGLAIIAPYWMDYVLDEKTVHKFVTYAKNVWGIEGDDNFDVARKSIWQTRTFFDSLDMPQRLREVGVDRETCELMASKTAIFGDVGNFRKLTKDDVKKILQSAC